MHTRGGCVKAETNMATVEHSVVYRGAWFYDHGISSRIVKKRKKKLDTVYRGRKQVSKSSGKEIVKNFYH